MKTCKQCGGKIKEVNNIFGGRKRLYCSQKCHDTYHANKSYNKYKQFAEKLGLKVYDVKLYGFKFLAENPEVVETLKIMNSIDTTKTLAEKKIERDKYNKEYFQKHKGSRDRTEYYKAYYEKNKEKLLSYSKEYREKYKLKNLAN